MAEVSGDGGGGVSLAPAENGRRRCQFRDRSERVGVRGGELQCGSRVWTLMSSSVHESATRVKVDSGSTRRYAVLF